MIEFIRRWKRARERLERNCCYIGKVIKFMKRVMKRPHVQMGVHKHLAKRIGAKGNASTASLSHLLLPETGGPAPFPLRGTRNDPHDR